MLGATSIWFVKVYNVTEVLRGAGSRAIPMVAYPLLTVFFYIRGAGSFLTTVPAEAMLGRPAWLGGGRRSAGAGSLFVARLLAVRAFTPVLPAREQGS